MKLRGLTQAEVELSRKEHGSNALTEIPPESLWSKILEGFKDPMIMILCVALVVQVILYLNGQAEWFEPVGILVAIIIANGVAAVSENKQENKAALLKAEEEAHEMAKVIRESELLEVHVNDVVVNDIVYVQTGDKVPADGVLVEGSAKIDQSALNGETEEAVKVSITESDSFDPKDLLNRFYVYRGTVLCSGEGLMQVKTVGDKTLFGELALEAQEETRETPLQVKLGKLAEQISKFGYIGAVAIIIGVLLKTFITGAYPTGGELLFGLIDVGWIRLIMDAITVAVTIIVCAVPEGLPMLTSILLSFQSFKMAKDNVLVRKIKGLETAGSLSILFSDKTGTITQGKLSVAEIATGNAKPYTSLSGMNEKLKREIAISIGTNNGANSAKEGIIGGNSTDRAMMDFIVTNMGRYVKESVVEFESFDSIKKTSSVVIDSDGIQVGYIKGAPEIILADCIAYLDENGVEQKLENKTIIEDYLTLQANRAMRLVAAAKKIENGLCLVCLVSIRDNVRKEAAEAIKEVQNAGVQVVMVTGDRKETAVAIANESNLITDKNNTIITSSDMNNMSDDEMKDILPKLCVVARALPTDKSRLVRIAQEMNYVVGMTGDGVNDSPALKKADVGFAMGSGTEAAKEAGDITILDDNFASVEKAILYGRTMFKSIRKFLIFQLTVNVAAVATCFLGPLLGENVVLTVIQLLLINLAMDTLAAIAYGSEPALKEYMKEKPVARNASIISKEMGVEIMFSAAYITLACLAILFFKPVRNLFGNVDVIYLKSALFATFMMAITFNGFNARTNHLNVFKDLGRNSNFILVMVAIFIMQYAFVTFGGEVLGVESLSANSWLICALIAFMVIPLDIIRKVIMR